jgi:hypothetical protein
MTSRQHLRIMDQESMVRIAAPTSQGSKICIRVGVDCASRKVSAAADKFADLKATVAGLWKVCVYASMRRKGGYEGLHERCTWIVVYYASREYLLRVEDSQTSKQRSPTSGKCAIAQAPSAKKSCNACTRSYVDQYRLHLERSLFCTWAFSPTAKRWAPTTSQCVVVPAQLVDECEHCGSCNCEMEGIVISTKRYVHASKRKRRPRFTSYQGEMDS